MYTPSEINKMLKGGRLSATQLNKNLSISVLKKAHTLLVEEGWTKGTFEDGHGYCALGAIREFDPKSATMARRFLRDAIGENRIASWNDQPSRTKEQVLAAFDKAIQLAENSRG